MSDLNSKPKNTQKINERVIPGYGSYDELREKIKGRARHTLALFHGGLLRAGEENKEN